MDSVVVRAARAERYNGKRFVVYDHQRRVPRRARSEAESALRTVDFAACRSFHELFLLIGDTLGPIKGIGDLTVYDTALRIAARLGLEPDRVYLHAGTTAGARALGLDWRAPWIMTGDLPPALRELPAWQVEDLLCIYKDHL